MFFLLILSLNSVHLRGEFLEASRYLSPKGGVVGEGRWEKDLWGSYILCFLGGNRGGDQSALTKYEEGDCQLTVTDRRGGIKRILQTLNPLTPKI